MIAIGSDHGGYALKTSVIRHLEERQIPCEDMGIHGPERSKCIVICTTGIGISITANKVPGIRCALCADSLSAKLTRQHNDANVLALGGGIIGENLALEIVDVFLDTPFSGEERHRRRIDQIES